MSHPDSLGEEKVIHSDPLSAWRYLCSHGGIELEVRDAGLDEELRTLLDARQPSLELALTSVTMESFVSAFFRLIQPYVSIFQDILAFFKQAEATQGQGQWVIKVDEIDIDLDHFREWIEKLTPAGKTKLQVVAVDNEAVWDLCRALRDREVIGNEIEKSFQGKQLNLPRDVQQWVEAYSEGAYLPMPPSLTPLQSPPELERSALIAHTAILVLQDHGMDRERLTAAYHNGDRPGMDRSDALDFWTIAQNETNLWLRTFVVALSAAATLLKPEELEFVGGQLDALLGPFPTKPHEFNRSFRDLESVLSLPIWKKRYELYSVWIGTEIVRALTADGHDLTLHHESGRIAFAFRETPLATVRSSPGPFQLISEKRTSLDQPVGHGRVAGVQPDYGLWTNTAGGPECRMVVEVKHYLRSAKSRFLEVLTDYARAFPEAQVYLVNHGPTGYIVDELDWELQGRCCTLDLFVPSNAERRRSLAEAVQECVGKPVRTWPEFAPTPRKGPVFAFDVSSSMNSLLNSSEAKVFLLDILAREWPEKTAAIDTSLVGFWPPTRDGFAALLRTQGGLTELAGPIGELLQTFDRVLVLTDEDGLGYLSAFHCEVPYLGLEPPNGLFLRLCTNEKK